ncbi:MAG: DUF481 domain-containing protein [Reichenbachiella sp.]
MMKHIFTFLISFVLIQNLNAQSSVKFSNGDELNGDIKSFQNGVLEIETDYSENNFLMDWDLVVDLQSEDNFLINLESGEKLSGKISIANKQATLTLDEGSVRTIDYLDIVFLNSISNGFWSRMSISLDGGLTISKASNNTQFSIKGAAAYENTSINPDVYFNFVENSIDDENGDPIKTSRDNYGGNFKYFLGKSWFAIAGADYLSSDEMQMDLRSTYILGIGYYPIRSYRMYLNSSVGLAINDENYMTSANTENRSSSEAYAALKYNAFGFKNVSLGTGIAYYPSLTQSNRHRVNVTFDLKFDLPRDFYIGGGVTYNYDSSPATEDISKSDYVIQTSLGWSL